MASRAAMSRVARKKVCSPFWAKTSSAYLARADSISSASLATLSGMGCLKKKMYCLLTYFGSIIQPLAYSVPFTFSMLRMICCCCRDLRVSGSKSGAGSFCGLRSAIRRLLSSCQRARWLNARACWVWKASVGALLCTRAVARLARMRWACCTLLLAALSSAVWLSFRLRSRASLVSLPNHELMLWAIN